MSQRVVDVLKVVEVQEECRDLGVLSSRAHQHSIDAVENQGTIGQPGERIVQCLVLELIGSLLHELHGTRTARAEYEDQQSQQKAEQGPPEEEQRWIALAEDASVDGGGKDVHVPPVMKVDRRRHRILGPMTGPKCRVRTTSLIVERHGISGVREQRRRQDRVGLNLGAGETNQGRAATGQRVRVAAISIQRCAHGKGGRAAQTVRGVGRLTGVAGLEQLRSERRVTHIEANRNLRQPRSCVFDVH